MSKVKPAPQADSVHVTIGGKVSATKKIGGSDHDIFNTWLIDSTMRSIWLHPDISDENRNSRQASVVVAMHGFAPQIEVEGMLVAQAVAMHHASMDASRRAMLPDQPFEIAQALRKSAASSSRAFCELVDALDRRRGKTTQQKVTVEHVHVHAGGQAIVGNVGAGTTGGGGEPQMRENPMHRLPDWRTTLPLALACPRCGARTRTGSPCRFPAMRNGRCRMHGGKSTGPSPEGRKRLSAARMVHGKYCRSVVELRRIITDDRREIRDLLRWAEE